MSLGLDVIQTVTSLQDVCSRPSANEIVTVLNLSGTYTIRRYATASPHAQVGTDIALPGQVTNVCMVTNDKVACLSTGSTTGYIVDLVSSVVTTITGLDTTPQNGRAQMMAGLTASSVAYGAGSTLGGLVKFDGAAVTASKVTPDLFSSHDQIWSIITATSTSFLIGTSTGLISEIDVNAKVVKQLALPARRVVPENYSIQRGIAQLCYYSGYVLALTNMGELYLIDWDSLKILQKNTFKSITGFAVPPLVMTNSSSYPCAITAGADNNFSLNVPVVELDMCLTPMRWGIVFQTGNLFGNRFSNIGIVGAKVWVASAASSKIYWLDLSAIRSITTEAVSFQDGSGNPLSGELIAIDDSVSPSQVMFHTTIPKATKQVPLTAGKNVLLIAQVGKGSDQTFDVRRIST